MLVKACFYTCLQNTVSMRLAVQLTVLLDMLSNFAHRNKAKTIPRMVFRLLETLANRNRKLSQAVVACDPAWPRLAWTYNGL